MLRGRKALVTGSTSGIGLGIARTLAAEGCGVMLNGFGDGVQVERLRAELADAFGVPVLQCHLSRLGAHPTGHNAGRGSGQGGGRLGRGG